MCVCVHTILSTCGFLLAPSGKTDCMTLTNVDMRVSDCLEFLYDIGKSLKEKREILVSRNSFQN